MHGLQRKLFSQLCCGFGIQLWVSGWKCFDRITGRSRFTYFRASKCILDSAFVLLHRAVSFELISARRQGRSSQNEFGC